MFSSTRRAPWSEFALLLLVGIALLIAAAASDAFDSPRAWTLLAVLFGGYALSRGVSRNDWPAGTRRSHRMLATPAPHEASAAGRETAAEVVAAEEQLQVDKVRQPHERVILRKEIVTEQVTVTVPLRREVVRLERVPIEPGDELAATGLAELAAGQTQELILMEERAVVDKRVVPRERVSLAKDVVTEDQQITETVRREEVDVDRLPPTDQSGADRP